jgi:hypothetical protein
VQQKDWIAEPIGETCVATPRLRLVVRRFDDCARFLVVKTGDARFPEALLSSGTEKDVGAAKAAATRAAIRSETILSHR